jgi:hypothetical protein
VPITIHTVYPNAAGLGLIMRFTGHVVGGHRNWPDEQPKWGYQPFGGIGCLRWTSGPSYDPILQFYHGYYDITDDFGTLIGEPGDPEALAFGADEHTLDFGTAKAAPGDTYWMRMRCDTQPDAPDGDGVTLYSFKVWNSADAEPAGWGYQVLQESQYALRQGGVGLLAHRIDVTFGDVVITQTPPSTMTLATLSGKAAPDLGPTRFALNQNHPNPFNPATTISMDIPKETSARLSIYDVQGRRVRDLFTGVLSRGVHTFEWDGRDDSGRGSATGVYMFRFESPQHTATRKMMLVR